MAMMLASVRIVDNTDQIKRATEESIAKALEIIGMKAEDYAKNICPVDTGRLKNSITHEQEDDYSEVIGTNVEYAPYVELGTQKQRAQPYLKPAAEDHVEEYKKIVESTLKNA